MWCHALKQPISLKQVHVDLPNARFAPQILFLIYIHYFLYFWEQNGACGKDSDCA